MTDPKPTPRPEVVSASTDAHYEEAKYCCAVCAAKRRCHICYEQTTFACSDCAIDLRAVVYVCSKLECRAAHEKKCPGCLEAGIASLREEIAVRDSLLLQAAPFLRCNSECGCAGDALFVRIRQLLPSPPSSPEPTK
jgi:hypothetical protein